MYLNKTCSINFHIILYLYLFVIITVAFSNIPQGTIFSPLLFLLIVNVASSVVLHSKIVIFVDNMKLFVKI